AENAYKHGFAALWQAGGGWAGLLLIYFIAPRARKFAQFTIPDLLEARYSQTARVLGVIAVLFAYTAITSYQLIGGGDILHLVFPTIITATLGKYIVTVFVIVFTAIAGMASVAYMDVVIGLLATITMCVALPVLIHHAGGWGAVHAALPATHFEVLGDLSFTDAMELMVPTMLLMLGNQAMYQKFFSAKSERDARVAVVGWIIGTVILETVIVAIAVVGSVLFPHGEVAQRPREIIAYSALHGLPAWLGALLMGAVFAKIMSTANNFLFSPATNLINDVFVRYISPNASNKRVLLVSRLMVVLLGIWALYQALGTQSVLQKTIYAYTIYAAALTPVILAAFYWKRANAAGAATAIAAGTFITVFWDTAFVRAHVPVWAADSDFAIFPALGAALVGLVVVSYVTRPPSKEQIDLFHGVTG
ncbi:MAG: sodium:solute symporter family protein, partial [Acidobacteriaceae bacterium]